MQSLHPALRPTGAAAFACCLLALASGPAAAQTEPAPDRFEAMTTANMTPSDLALEIQVLEWSDRTNRDDVLAALTAESAVRSKLTEMPTRGYIWVEGSSVGYSIKYAHRTTNDDGHDRITLVTDRPLGQHSFNPWQIGGEVIPEETQYSVLELDLNDGIGFLSPAADVVLDEDSATVTLQPNVPEEPVLADIRIAQPYGAQDGQRQRQAEAAP